jgi:hypothetical protein
MDDIDRKTVCGECGKRLPDEKETARVLLARKRVSQVELERYAKQQKFDFCVGHESRFDKAEVIRDVFEADKGEDDLSYEDQRAFQVGTRSVGLDTRVDRPLWCNDEVATRLVLLLQYPLEEIDYMYGLICEHWRGTAPMKDHRRDMMELRKRGENVFGENTSLKAEYLKEDSSLVGLEDEDILAKLPLGWFYIRKTAFDVIMQCQLTFLQRDRYLLHWKMWNLLRAKASRSQRYRMTRTGPEWMSWREKILSLIQEANLHRGDYPFISKLSPFAHPELGWLLLREVFWEGALRGIFSLPYLFYVFRECGQDYWRKHDKPKFKRPKEAPLSKKRYVEIVIMSTLVMMISLVHLFVLGCLKGLCLVFRWHPSALTSILTACLMLPVSIWAFLLTLAISFSADGKRVWFRLFTSPKLQ